jgi:ribosomal protein S18 acetylase RimI-like enzyme
VCLGGKLPVIVLHMHEDDIEAVSNIHSQQFSRQKDSVRWISCNFSAFPRIMIFVARDEKDKVIGYIQWIQKSGFRQEAVFELEQIAVLKDKQGKGIGTLLIEKSLKYLKDYLTDTNSTLKAVLVTTSTDNVAKSLYEKVLKAKEIAVIKDLYSHDEVIMITRDV